MTTERSSFEQSGSDSGATGDDALTNADALVGTREDEMTSTGLSDAPYAGTSTSESAWDAGTSAPATGDRLTDAAGSVASRVADTAQQQIGTKANTQLTRASDILGQVANAVRQSGEQMRQDQPQIASFADTAASQVDRAAQFFRQTDFNGLVREGENFARRQPALFLGGAMLLGVVASRFLKAAPQGGESDQFGRSYGYGGGYGSSYGRGAYDRSSGAGSFAGSAYDRGSYGGTAYGAAAAGTGSGYGTAYGAGSDTGAGGYGGGSGYTSAANTGATGTGTDMSSGSTDYGAADDDQGGEHDRV